MVTELLRVSEGCDVIGHVTGSVVGLLYLVDIYWHFNLQTMWSFLTSTFWTPTITQTQLNTLIITNSDPMFSQSILKYANREAPPLYVVSGFCMSGAAPLFPLYAFISCRRPTLISIFHLYTKHVCSSTPVTKICDRHNYVTLRHG